MGRHLALFFILSLINSPSFATITVSGDVNATGASNVATLPGGIAPTIFYSNVTAIPDGAGYFPDGGGINCSTTINPNCKNTNNAASFGFSESTGSGNGQFVVLVTGTSAGQTIPPTTAPSTPTPITTYGTVISSVGYGGAGNFYYTNGTWGALCQALASAGVPINPSCTPNTADAPLTVQLSVIADANGDNQYDSGDEALQFSVIFQSYILASASIANLQGIYGFWTYPGDSEVHLHGAVQSSLDGTTIQYARFYYVVGPDIYNNYTVSTFGQIAPILAPSAAINHFDIPLNSDGTLQSYYITGLNNNTSYYFRSAAVDYAGNIGYLTGGGAITNQPDDDPGGAPYPFQIHAAKPEQIAGLLTKNGTCFIATAAYGTPMAKQVQILREFRDKILMKTSSGQKFIYWYYNNGEYWANRIKNHGDIRAVVRGLLYPIIGFGWLALKIGAFNATLVLVTLLLLPLLMLQFKRSRRTFEEFS